MTQGIKIIISEDQKEQIKQLHINNDILSMAKISKIVGLPRHLVENYFKENNLKIRDRGTPTTEQIEKVKTLFNNEKLSKDKIVERLKIPHHIVSKIFKSLQLKSRVKNKIINGEKICFSCKENKT